LNRETIMGQGTNVVTTGLVLSADGTRIGYRRLGRGPSMILFHRGVNASQHMLKLGRALVRQDGDQASDLYEFDGFEGSISKGRSKSAKYEFLVEDKKDLNDRVIQVTPSWDSRFDDPRGCRQVVAWL
jgi:hypothetical protein